MRRIAFSAARYEPGAGNAGPDRETIEAVRELEQAVLRAMRPGTAGKSDRDVLIALLWLAEECGSMIPVGVRVSVSVRELALSADLLPESWLSAAFGAAKVDL